MRHLVPKPINMLDRTTFGGIHITAAPVQMAMTPMTGRLVKIFGKPGANAVNP